MCGECVCAFVVCVSVWFVCGVCVCLWFGVCEVWVGVCVFCVRMCEVCVCCVCEGGCV